MTTRFTGELPLDAVHTPARPEPSLLEVTQPFMPAIRGQAPEFAKRLSPGEPTPAAGPGSRQLPTEPPAPTRVDPAETTSPTQPPAAPQPKRRSLARRVVRSILGPDLLRKDPKRR
ncbi:hypothetical protein [Allosaccharopolyspora coralli]|uniref:hypothetical protein n=1 Tax=Allosaccharopolyspora coralli TaxID=2665642 RepID=UPI001C9E6C84|nr:hypothetical protein [Allosaccharopolyspora coralli]